MLYVKPNAFRNVINLNGIWEFKPVDDSYVPCERAIDSRPMAVPASMNDITVDAALRDYVGKVLYETEFSVSVESNKLYRLRIGAASHKCEVYLNGEKAGEGKCGQLPVDLPLALKNGKNRLSVLIDNRLDRHTLPMGQLIEGNRLSWCDTAGKHHVFGSSEKFPAQKQIINHDFFNYTGIHRDVLVYSLPVKHIEDITIHTVADGDYSKVKVDVVASCNHIRYEVFDERGGSVAVSGDGMLMIASPVLWEPRKPYLYTLRVTAECDEYEEKFGIRKVTYDEKCLYVNDKPVYLKGFGKHEDFFVSGKGNNSAVNVRDFELLDWIHANSFRTSHYPYCEEILYLADRYGFMVIDECPAVGCNHWQPHTFGEQGADSDTENLHKETLSQLIARDKNHPSVVMISVGNEAATFEASARPYFESVISHVRKLTDLPVMIAEESKFSEGNHVADLADFIGLNRYFGWYDEIGRLEAIEPMLINDLEAYYNEFRKPIIVTEFGVDTIEGVHSLPATAFSEEYQTEYLAENCRVFDGLPYVVGEHVWNFADFMTKQGTIRMRGNRKGVFTRDRQPKQAAYFLRERWKNKDKK